MQIISSKNFLFLSFSIYSSILFRSLFYMQEQIFSLVQSFFQGLGIAFSDLSVNVQDQDIQINLQTSDSALLIGMHGKNIEIFQHLLSRMIEKIVGRYVHVHMEVNDYMKLKDERLFRFLDTKITFVMSTGKSSKIPNLNAYERKKAHNYIAEKSIAWLITRSEWEGAERTLTLEYTGVIRQDTQHAWTSSQAVDLAEDGVGI